MTTVIVGMNCTRILLGHSSDYRRLGILTVLVRSERKAVPQTTMNAHGESSRMLEMKNQGRNTWGSYAYYSMQ
eukprot:3574822-Amphidinium_carterae.1